MKKSLFSIISYFALATLIFIPDNFFAQSLTKAGALFNFVGETKQAEKRVSVAGVRQQSIKINFKTIDSLQAEQIEIPLFDGEVLQAVKRETEGFVRQNADTFSWTGKIYSEDGSSSDVILTVYKNAMSGLIYAPSGVYSIIPQAKGAHILVEIDQSLFPANEDDVEIVDASNEANPFTQQSSVLDQTFELFGQSPNNSNQQLAPQVDDGSRIDVMIVYTDDVRAFLGGTTQAQAFAQQAVTLTNTAYQNSAIATRVRLVHAVEINYAEASNSSTHLNYVRNDATIATLRNTYKADAVSFFTETSNSGNCGLASLMGVSNHSAAFESRAFSTGKRSCAIDNLTFPHELGHNQGANHDPDNAGTTPANAVFPYASGHFSAAGNFRTVMTYPAACSGCPRRPYFSNPNVLFGGQPTGIVDQRDNARTINNTALVFSRFRESLVVTAASVTVGGRVVALRERGVNQAVVSLTNQSGNTRMVRTNSSGYYRFDKVTAGETYLISASSKRYSFAAKVVNVTEELLELDFTAQQ